MATHLLLDLKSVHHRSELAQNLISLLVEFELGRDEVGQVSERLGRVENLDKIHVSWTSPDDALWAG
jgi:hypothetical protein